jgi:hypothetical protein
LKKLSNQSNQKAQLPTSQHVQQPTLNQATVGQASKKQLFKNYVNRNKDRLEKIPGKGDKLIPTIYWLVHEQNEGSLMALVNNAGEYGVETFKSLIDQFDFTQFGSEKKLTIERKLWRKLDKAKYSVSCTYQNLLYLDNKLFNSLQANEILH